MRTIERHMLNAISNRKNWKESNTEVRVSGTDNDADSVVNVYLHGNKIAQYCYHYGKLWARYMSLAGWNTPTTRSRLRALGANVRCKDFCAQLNGEDISSACGQWYEF